MNVRKAAFPAAGLGTRFLPATKAQPKEMPPLVDTPSSLRSGGGSGLRARGDRPGHRPQQGAIENHFDAAFELEYYLQARGKVDELAQIRPRTVSVRAGAAFLP